MKFATTSMQQYSLYLRCVATVPSEIKNSNFLQICSKYGRKCKQQSTWYSATRTRFWYLFEGVHSNKVDKRLLKVGNFLKCNLFAFSSISAEDLNRKFEFLTSQGSVARCLRWDGYCYVSFVANFIRFPAVPKFWESVKIWPVSYTHLTLPTNREV